MRKSQKQNYEIQDDTPKPCFTSYLCSWKSGHNSKRCKFPIWGKK